MGALFGGGSKSTTTTTAVTPVTRMPVQFEQDRAAAAQTRRRTANRKGRSSTILSRRGEAGSTAYSNSLLGQAG